MKLPTWPSPTHKYHAEPTTVDGIRFASKKEARRYAELKLLAKAGEINGLEIQPILEYEINGAKIFKYLADFAYHTRDNRYVVEDVKGIRTAVYKLKKKIIEAAYGISIVEI